MDATLMLSEIGVFAQVVEAGSFTAAARRRAVPKSTVSRSVARLEDALRMPLLRRTSRRVVLTPAGESFYERVASHVSGVREAAVAVGEHAEAPRGRLRVTASVDVGEWLLADVLVRFAERHPEVHLDVDLSDRTANLVQDGYDVAIRGAERLKDSALVARKLVDVRSHLFASPAYLARRGAPGSVEELARHDCVLPHGHDGRADWTLSCDGAERAVSVAGRVCGDGFSFARSVLRAGGGVGPLPPSFAAADVREGRLAPVLPGWSSRAGALYFVYAGARHLPKKVTAFRDFMLESLRESGARGAR